jgi:hypothetical protein
MFVSSLDSIEIVALYAPAAIVSPHTFDDNNKSPTSQTATTIINSYNEGRITIIIIIIVICF